MYKPVFNLGIDIDGTVNDMNYYLNMHSLQWMYRLGLQRVPDLSKYFIEDRFNINKNFAKTLMESLDYSAVPILNEFIENCHHLNDERIKIYYITHRDPFLPQTFKDTNTNQLRNGNLSHVTKKQLSDIPLKYVDIVYTDDKAKVCKELGIDLMIEDSPHELENLLSNDVPTMKILYEYNSHIDLPIIENWETFLSNFKISEIFIKKINGGSVMRKIVFIDDDRQERSKIFDVRYVDNQATAFNIFADDYVYDVVSLDGRFPYTVLPVEKKNWDRFILSHMNVFKRHFSYTDNIEHIKSKIQGGIYLLFLMDQFKYIPKVVVLHSFDTAMRFMMEDVIKQMFYNYPVVITYMDKSYPMKHESIKEIEMSMSKYEDYSKTAQNPDDYYTKLEKGKNYFILTPTESSFYKNGQLKDVRLYKSGLGKFIKAKIDEGYEFTYGREYITNDYNFKCLPIHF